MLPANGLTSSSVVVTVSVVSGCGCAVPSAVPIGKTSVGCGPVRSGCTSVSVCVVISGCTLVSVCVVVSGATPSV